MKISRYSYIYTQRKVVWGFSTIIIDAVKDGHLSPETAASYFNIAESRIAFVGSFVDTGTIKFSGDSKFYTLDHEDENIINQNRNRLGLFHLEDFEQKIRYGIIQEERKSKFKVLKLGSVYQYPIEAKSVLKVKEVKSVSRRAKEVPIVN